MQLIPSECIKMNAVERIQTSLKLATIVLFMKGSPRYPADGYQAEAIQILAK
jgi:glutaredoxin-related protein